MIAAIHQQHYFPWMGYFDKMAKSDVFILMDDVQLNDNSFMFRHQLLSQTGEKKYISVAFEKKNYMEKKYREVLLNQAVAWQTRQLNYLTGTYGKAPFFKETMDIIGSVFTKNYTHLCEVTYDTIMILRDVLGVDTPLVMQSSLDYDGSAHKNELVISLCKAVGADRYLSGNGARKYMDLDEFERSGISVQYQTFSQPEYPQRFSDEFVGGLSTLDAMFNIGAQASKGLFQSNIVRE